MFILNVNVNQDVLVSAAVFGQELDEGPSLTCTIHPDKLIMLAAIVYVKYS